MSISTILGSSANIKPPFVDQLVSRCSSRARFLIILISTC